MNGEVLHSVHPLRYLCGIYCSLEAWYGVWFCWLIAQLVSMGTFPLQQKLASLLHFAWHPCVVMRFKSCVCVPMWVSGFTLNKYSSFSLLLSVSHLNTQLHIQMQSHSNACYVLNLVYHEITAGYIYIIVLFPVKIQLKIHLNEINTNKFAWEVKLHITYILNVSIH